MCACPAIHNNALMFSPVEKKAQLYKLCVRTLLQIIFMIILLMHNCCRHWYSVLSSIQLTGDINFDSWYSLLFVSVFRSIRLHSSGGFCRWFYPDDGVVLFEHQSKLLIAKLYLICIELGLLLQHIDSRRSVLQQWWKSICKDNWLNIDGLTVNLY